MKTRISIARPLGRTKPFSTPSYKNVVSKVGAYSVGQLMQIAASNQTLPSLHTYSFSNIQPDVNKDVQTPRNIHDLRTIQNDLQEQVAQKTDELQNLKEKRKSEKQPDPQPKLEE